MYTVEPLVDIPLVLDIKSPNVKYHLILSDKVTIVQGFSGTGKTYLYNLIDGFNNYSESSEIGKSVEIFSNRPCRVLTANESLQLVTRYIQRLQKSGDNLNSEDVYKRILSELERSLETCRICEHSTLAVEQHVFSDAEDVLNVVVVDEDTECIDYPAFRRALREAPYVFIVINRDTFPELPISCHAIKELELENGVNIFRERYLQFYSIEQLPYSKLFVEDSGAGYEIYKRTCRYLSKSLDSIDSLFGKDRLLTAFAQNTKTLFILDGLGLGGSIYSIFQMIQDFRETGNRILLIESFEFMILNSLFFHNGGYYIQHPSILESNKEEYYYRQYKDFIAKNLLGPATKSSLPRCFKIICSCVEDGAIHDLRGCHKSQTFKYRKGNSCEFEIPACKYPYLIRSDIYSILANLRDLPYTGSVANSEDSTNLFTSVF